MIMNVDLEAVGTDGWSAARRSYSLAGWRKWRSLAGALRCVFFLLLILSWMLGCAQSIEPDKRTSGKADPLKLAAANFVSRQSSPRPGLHLQRGEKVLLVVTSRLDLTVIEAVSAAVREKGGFLDVVWLDKILYSGSEVNIDWIQEAKLGEYDKLVASRGIRLAKPAISFRWSSKEEFLFESYPPELVEQIKKKVWAVIRTTRSVRFTAPNGTDLTFTLDDFHWEQMGGDRDDYSPIRGQSFRPGHGLKLNPALTRHPDASGTIVVDAAPPQIPQILRWTVREGKIVEISGGGEVGDKLRRLSGKYKDTDFDIYPGGPGFNWLTEFTLVTKPGKKQGTVHVTIGEGLTGKGLDDDPDYIDFDYYLHGGTLTIDGKNILERGQLLVLEEPEIRAQLLEHEQLLSSSR